MVTVSHGFDCADLFALLSLRRVEIPYPLMPATQITEEQIYARRSAVADAVHANAAWTRQLGPLVRACEEHRASVDLRYVAGPPATQVESGAVVLFDDHDEVWLVSVVGAAGRALLVPADRAVAALVDLLPVLRAAPVTLVTVPPAVIAQLAAESGPSPATEAAARPGASPVAGARQAFAAVGATTGVGQIGSIVRAVTPPASVVRSDSTVIVIDGRGGRLLQLTSRGPTGEESVTLAAGSPGAVHRAVADQLTRTSQRSAATSDDRVRTSR